MFAHTCFRIGSEQTNNHRIIKNPRQSVEYLMRGPECCDSHGGVAGWSVWHPSKMRGGRYLFNQ